jgi:biopolymer transport protein ExbB
MTQLFLSVLSQSESMGDSIASPSLPATAPTDASFSLWELIVRGGPVMIPIGLLSIVAVYLFIERYFAIRKAGKYDQNFMHSIRDFIMNNNIESARLLCRNSNTPIARMVEKGINRIGRPIKDIETAIENVGKVEVGKMEKNVGFLGTIAGIAPMFGFLGTIFGVIKIFYQNFLQHFIGR